MIWPPQGHLAMSGDFPVVQEARNAANVPQHTGQCPPSKELPGTKYQ